MSVNITFGAINVNAQDTNATISIGETLQSGWSAHSKYNFGTGMLFGVNNSANIVNTILDNDAIDAPIMDNDGVQAGENQSL